jgi:SAM-dependent methyltransferase
VAAAETYPDVLRRAYAKRYAERTDEWTDDPAMRCVPALVQGELKLSRHARALDVGCGAGRDVAYLSTFLDRVMGLDTHRHAAWERIASGRGPGVAFVCGDLGALRGAARFDLILDNGCFHHQHPGHRATHLGRIMTLLQPGGHFVLSTFKRAEPGEHVDADGRIHTFFGDEELAGVLRAADFEIVRQLDIHRLRTLDYYRLSFCRARVARPASR